MALTQVSLELTLLSWHGRLAREQMTQ